MTYRRPTPQDKECLHAKALSALRGVGDRAHQWDEWTGYAFHVRRRLTAEEQAQGVGEVRDLRGTAEGFQRLEVYKDILPLRALKIGLVEVSELIQKAQVP